MTTLIKHVEDCLSLADEYKSKVTPEILNMDGMSGKKKDIFIIIFVQ